MMAHRSESALEMYILTLFYVLSVVNIACGKSIVSEIYDFNRLEHQVAYLKKYGYLDDMFDIGQTGSENTKDKISDALSHFQQMAGLPVTGQADEKTRTKMAAPRCGLPDVLPDGSQRAKRYVIQGNKLQSHYVTYTVSQYTGDLSKESIDYAYRKATEYWSAVADLYFTRLDLDSAIIRLRFAEGYHGDGVENTFDGPGNTLAHAFFPGNEPLSSDIHLDDAETWTLNSYEGTALLQVLTHEMGHSLGLMHSDETQAVMSAFYKGYSPDYALHPDDIAGIQFLYGPSKTYNQATSTSTTTAKAIDTWYFNSRITVNCALEYCRCGRVQAIARTQVSYEYFIFYDEYIYKTTQYGLAEGYPTLTHYIFPEVPANTKIDTALTWPASYGIKLLLFAGDMVYIYLYSPSAIIYVNHGPTGALFQGITSNITASYFSQRDEKTYLFSDNLVYRLERLPTGEYVVESGYPKSTASWNFPNGISPDDTVTTLSGIVYFFFGDRYYIYYNNDFLIPEAAISVRTVWFRCQASARMVDATNNLQVAASRGDNEGNHATSLHVQYTLTMSFLSAYALF